jgi:outer membrane immunogenic protein
MFHKLLGVLGVSSLLVAATAAGAAKAPPMPVPMATWNGCYVGGNVGGAWQRDSAYDAQAAVATGSDTGNAVIGGAQVGCDYQFSGRWVLGIQDMLSWTGVHGAHGYPGFPAETLTYRTDRMDTLTARLGYTIAPQMLLYVKGGGAWANITDMDIIVPPGGYFGQVSSTRSGWTIGGGVEYAFIRNWSAFAEYSYIDLGTKGMSLVYSCGAGCPGPNPYTYNVTQNISQFVVGLNFRFLPIDAR